MLFAGWAEFTYWCMPAPEGQGEGREAVVTSAPIRSSDAAGNRAINGTEREGESVDQGERGAHAVIGGKRRVGGRADKKNW